MFEKNMKLAYLLDFYGDVLDEHTRSLMASYYEDDLSLSEIAADAGISRQGVRHMIKKGEEQLVEWENKLGLAAHYRDLSEVAKTLQTIADGLRAGEGELPRRAYADALTDAAQTVLNKPV